MAGWYFHPVTVAPGVQGSRAQSEVTGSMLLVGVVVVTASVGGVAVWSEVLDHRPQVSAVVEVEVTDGAILIDHDGGEQLDLEHLEVHYRTGGTAAVVPFDDPGATVGDGDRRFEPGERWNYTGVSFSQGQRVEVVVVHTESNAVLFDGSRVVDAVAVVGPVPGRVPTALAGPPRIGWERNGDYGLYDTLLHRPTVW